MKVSVILAFWRTHTSSYYSGGSVVKNLPANVGDEGLQVRSLGWEDPPEEGMQPTPVFLPGESHGQRSLEGYSPWGYKDLDSTW